MTQPRKPAEPSAVGPVAVPDLFQLRMGAVRRFIVGQPVSFWAVNFYMFIEYVRPQSVWPVIDVLPWGMTALLLTIVAFVAEGKPPSFRTPVGALLLVYSGILVLSSVFVVSQSLSLRRFTPRTSPGTRP